VTEVPDVVFDVELPAVVPVPVEDDVAWVALLCDAWTAKKPNEARLVATTAVTARRIREDSGPGVP